MPRPETSQAILCDLKRAFGNAAAPLANKANLDYAGEAEVRSHLVKLARGS